jgi:glycolate oxidase iron-sulfur subunit
LNERDLKKQLSQAADQCVKCGLCLPCCPTYRLRADEAESPRGRIALIQGLVWDKLADSERLRAHLGSCLECRACETACPSLVQFGLLMDGARALQSARATPPRRAAKRALLAALSSTLGVRGASLVSAIYRRTGLAVLAERTGLARRPALRAYHRVALQLGRPATLPGGNQAEETGEEIHLFLGCIARSAQADALRAAHRVLVRMGFRVRIPQEQVCCGAMHRHNGFPQEADLRLGQNASCASGQTIVGIASACVAELRGHPQLADAQEICRFLADLDWPKALHMRPLTKTVAVHEPCSQRNQLRDAEAAYALLRRIPGLEPVALPDNAFCCGAAGTYLLQQPAMSQALLAPKIEALASLGAEILVTTNTGCAVHLAAGARETGLKLEVLHPVELIARQLAD